MSLETREWLSTNTLIGFTDKRGNAWHHREGDTNHYPGAVPVERVERLFSFTVDPKSMYVMAETSIIMPNDVGDGAGMEHDDANPYTEHVITTPVEIPNRKAWTHSQTGEVLGIFTDGYRGHQYGQWLVDNVLTILHGELGVASAGLLRGGRQAWVSVEVPEAFTTPEGVVFRPNLTACTSFDGSLATTYKRMVTAVVCDNTLAAGLRERGQTHKVRHSANSLTKISDVRDALMLIEQDSEQFAADVAALTNVTVTDGQWDRIVGEILAPMPPEGKTTRGRTLAETKRSTLHDLWTNDRRVTPWTGTAFGVLQADNTYRQHFQTSKGMGREERNMVNAIEGTSAKADVDTVRRVLELVGA
jgi:phage/plasmid-like protein (TIGR03299 family)